MATQNIHASKENKTIFRAETHTHSNSALWSKLEGVHSKLAEILELILAISIQLLDFIGSKKRKKKKKKKRDKKHFAP